MIITICGSMQFAQKMLDYQSELIKMGHEVYIPIGTDKNLDDQELNMNFDYCSKINCLEDHWQKIQSSEAILVLNMEKNGIQGYVGGSVLMEIAVAKFAGKKIFFLNPYPSEKDLRYAFEIKLIAPLLIDGDLEKIK